MVIGMNFLGLKCRGFFIFEYEFFYKYYLMYLELLKLF